MEDIVIPIAGMLFVLTLVLGIPLVRHYVRRAERADQLGTRDPEADARLDRIENAIDAMAVEVERISEGQRFITKLLAERPSQPAALGSPGGTSGQRADR